jgi:phage baseplate assembly protein W
MLLAYPYRFDGRRRTAGTDGSSHVRDLIEQLLFTQPGERVNRPDFGSGVMQLVFAAASPEVAATVEFLVRGALQQFLADRIAVDRVTAEAVDTKLVITVDYVVLATGESQSVTLERGGSQ